MATRDSAVNAKHGRKTFTMIRNMKSASRFSAIPRSRST
jgi:hypothetical protein